MSFRAVIFDMDGVLIDSEPLWEETEIKLLKSMGAEYDPAFRDNVVGLSQVDSSKLIIAEFGLDCSPEELIEKRLNLLLRVYDEKLTMFDGAKPLINGLRERGIKTALASSSPTEAISFVLEKFSIRDLFDAVISGDCIKNGKPAPDIYLLAAAEIGVKPSECAAIEDSPKGAQSAAAAGMFCIAIPDKRLNAEEFEICDAICENICEAEAVILRV
ncbi:MAG: HAD-IA family hydrolase [Candidatus Mycalebacterium zealandia]|nr:MAG: HAD-IA family hydrolase [Candidatus Mycalebacterium zealandia]